MDTVLHFTLADGTVRGLLIDSTQAVRKAQALQGSSAVAAAALGRALTATAMLSSTLKEKDSSVTLTLDGDGPLKKIVCVGSGFADPDSGGEGIAVRGYVQNHTVQLPLANGRLDIGGGVGRNGRLSVVKDLRMKNPYIGQVALRTGEIAEDLAYYYVQSEQTPSLVGLGVIASDVTVPAAGGVLLQAMPGCDDATIDQLELRSPIFGDIANELQHETPDKLLSLWLGDLGLARLESRELRYECPCSKLRMERALISLGAEELKHMITDEVEGAELVCHFCNRKYQFTTQDLLRLLNRCN